MTGAANAEAAAPDLLHVQQAVQLGRLDMLIGWAERAPGVALRRFLVAQANGAAANVDPGALSSGDLSRAHALGITLSRDLSEAAEPPPHSVIVPFALPRLSVAQRMLMSFSFDDEPTRLRMQADTTDAIASAVGDAARIASPPYKIDRYRFTMWKTSGENAFSVSGRSLGPAALVSAVSLWQERAVEKGTAITGVIEGTRVTAAGGLSEKVDGLAARADLLRLIVARGEGEIARALLSERGRSDVSVVEVSDIAQLVATALVAERSSVVDPDEAMIEMRREFERAWETFRWPVLRERVERLAGSGLSHRPDVEVELWTMVGAARRHLGDPTEGLRALDRASIIASRFAKKIPDAPLARLATHRSMTYLALGDLKAASLAAARARRIARRARLRGEEIKALGCIGLVMRARGRLRAAATAQFEALTLVHEYKPSSCARSHAYLIDCLGAAGDIDGARRAYDQGLDHLQGLDAPRARDHESWLRISLGGALVSNDRMRQAAEILDVPCVQERIDRDANPGLWARRYLGVALCHEAASLDRGLALLAASPGAYSTAVGSRLVAVAHVNVLLEARSRVAAAKLDHDSHARLLRALGRISIFGERDLAELAVIGPKASAQLDALVSRALSSGL
ncbi:MAG: hypothetical protein IPK60_22595 [Sandaracinaceae bacterium]|nr:hypothetical protein [Sandaracinaceae bacterium]